MAAVLALRPALDSLGHWAKFVSNYAVGTADDRVSAVRH